MILDQFFEPLFFRWTTLTWLELFDLALVVGTVYILLGIVRHTGAALLLRGAMVITGILFLITIVLPLPAFDWLVRGVLLVMLVAMPIIFQPELRRLFEQIGRTTGMGWDVSQTTVEHVLPELVRAVEHMSASQTGALIALEGRSSLGSIIETGVTVNGEVSSELLQTIFYSSNPLHDGAVVMRGNQVAAAGCVLPLTERPLHFKRRLGTRHRAATGLSEKSDALVVVVSEETGQISVARDGELHRPLDIASLRQHLLGFYTPANGNKNTQRVLWKLATDTLQSLHEYRPWSSSQRLRRTFSLFSIALVIGVAVWIFVMQQENPAVQDRIDNIPLMVEGVPAGTTVATDLPGSVSVVVEGRDDVVPTLSSRSFQAQISLEGMEPGLHHLPVNVTSAAARVRIVSQDPEALDVELAEIISRTMEVTVNLLDQQALSRAYQVVGAPAAVPSEVVVTGAAPLVNQVAAVETSLSVANASTSLYEVRPVRAVDENGREVSGVSLQPAQVGVGVTIRRRINARDVGVRVATIGSPAPGYWLSGLTVTPTNVTLQGSPEQLAEASSFVDTLPVDINNAAGDIFIQIPLDLPEGIQALTNEGNTAKTVTVNARITPRQGNLAVSRPVTLVGMSPELTVSVAPPEVNVILSGPLPVLNEIESVPDLVQVIVDASEVQPGQTASLTATIAAPDDIRARMVPSLIAVTRPEESEAEGDR